MRMCFGLIIQKKMYVITFKNKKNSPHSFRYHRQEKIWKMRPMSLYAKWKYF